MLTRKKPLVIPSTLELIGQGETISFNLTYFNRSQEEYADLLQKQIENNTLGTKDGVVEQLQFMVESWDSEYPLTEEGIRAAESDRPKLIRAIMEKFEEARSMSRVKNSKPQ